MYKNRKVTIRITESAFKNLCDQVIENELTMSNIIRNLIDNSGNICRKDLINKNIQQTMKIVDNKLNTRKNGKQI
ncbi:hypothetical protein V7S79_12185 [Aquirufa sp. ROCK-SH2]